MKPQICSIHLAFNWDCFEAVLIENTPKTLGVIQVVENKKSELKWIFNLQFAQNIFNE